MFHLFHSNKQPKKRLFIHAGNFKTGTSSFQHLLYHNKEALADQKLYFPTRGLGLSTPRNKYAHRVLGIRISQGKKSVLPDIIDELTSSNKFDTALISYEGFSQKDTIIHLPQYLKARANLEVHCIYVTRPYVDHAISLYREISQNVGAKADFESFIDHKTKEMRTWFGALLHGDVLEAWRNILPRKNIHIFNYGHIKSKGLDTLLSPVGAYRPLIPPQNIIKNHTISAPAAAFMRLINKHNLNEKKRTIISQALGTFDAMQPQYNDYCEIAPEQALEIDTLFDNDRKKLRKLGYKKHVKELDHQSWKWGMNTNYNDAVEPFKDQFIAYLSDLPDQSAYELLKSTLAP